MPTMIVKILASVGGLFNRVRGGLDIWNKDQVPFNKIWFPVFLGLVTLNPYVVLGCYVGQQICGWGSYIGALTVNATPVPECKAIDWLCSPFKWNNRLFGFTTLTLRGFVWTAPIALAMLNGWILLIGLLFPVSYAIPTLLLLKTKHNKDKTAWNIGEYVWGIILTYGVLTCC